MVGVFFARMWRSQPLYLRNLLLEGSPEDQMKPVTILSSTEFELTINRLCHQLIEDHDDLSTTALIGLQPRGVFLLSRVEQVLKKILGNKELLTGHLDITFHRDDIHRYDAPLTPSTTQLDFSLENKNVVLIDDVLYTGRSTRAGLEALLHFGRPEKVQLMCMIDRRFSRHLPIQPDYIGRWVDTIETERVEVKWKEVDGKDEVILYSSKDERA